MTARLLCLVLALWSAPAAAQTLTMTPNPVDAGAALVGQSTTSAGSLRSDGQFAKRYDLAVISSTCTGGSGTFTLNPSQGVRPAPEEPIDVSFAPSTRGVRTCTVRVYEEGTTNQVASFSIRGTGEILQSLNVTAPTPFTSVRYSTGATSSRNITVTNTGDRTLNISTVLIGGTNAADFAITAGGTGASTIAGGQSRTWTVVFNPSAVGARTATMTFASNDPVSPTRTINLAGTGTTASISASPSMVDFGLVQVGSSRSMDVTVANTASTSRGPLAVMTGTLSNNSEGWFALTSCGSTTSCPLSLSVDATPAIVGVRCQPPLNANATPRTATLTLASDSDTSGGNVMTLSCTASFSAVALSNAAIDFGSQLIGTTATQLVTVTNSGNTSASYTLAKTGVNASQFTVSGPTSVGAGATVTLTVSFTASTEGAVSAGLDVNLSGGGGPSLAMAGRGVERHIAVIETVLFPDTYRSAANTQPIAIMNTGEYPLTLSAIELNGDAAVWALAEPFMPLQVPGLSAVDVLVRFTPGTVGKVPDATMMITSDDPARPTAPVLLSGNGIERRVEVGPRLIELGDRAVGTTTRLSAVHPGELIWIANFDEASFQLREVTGDGAFSAIRADGTALGGSELAPGANETIDVIFAPTEEGLYEGELGVFLDDDPNPHGTITVVARAITVDAHGGGGCSTTRGTGFLALLALVLLRRRRR